MGRSGLLAARGKITPLLRQLQPQQMCVSEPMEVATGEGDELTQFRG